MSRKVKGNAEDIIMKLKYKDRKQIESKLRRERKKRKHTNVERITEERSIFHD